MNGNRKPSTSLWLIQLTADFAAIVSAYYLTLAVRFHTEWGPSLFTAINRVVGVDKSGHLGDLFEDFYVINAPRIILYLCVTTCFLYALRHLYSERRFIRKRPVAWNVVAANVTALAIFYAYFYLSRNVFHPRSFFACVLFLNSVFCVSFRSALDWGLQISRRVFGVDRCRTILVGVDSDMDMIWNHVRRYGSHGIEIVEKIRIQQEAPWQDIKDKIAGSVDGHRADMIILADEGINIAQTMEVLEIGGQVGIPVKVLARDMDVLMRQAMIPVDVFHGVPMAHFDAPSREGIWEDVKNATSKCLAALLLVFLSPLLLVIAVLVRMTSSGPVLFVQERIGVNRKPFKMYKFRTMRDRAEELQAQVEEFNESGRGLFKIRNDPRVTPVGRFLRRFSLDELPQLLNVVRGEMNIVGPRPLPKRDFENYYEEWHYSRHEGKPGLTCLWQISGRSDMNFHSMCILDVYYLRNRSWILDLRIVLRTFRVVLLAKGAY